MPVPFFGSFGYSYVDTTSRLSEVTYPNGQKTDYSYFNNAGGQRLQEINNYISGMFSNTPLSKFDYTYNAVGTIASWSQQTDTNPTSTNALTYDNADQLTSSTNVLSGTNIASNNYAYDPAGNRLAETTLSGVNAGQFNNVNQLTGYSSTTTNETIAGYTSAAVSSVKVNAVPASISNSTNFTATVPLPNGTNIVSVVAQPSSSNTPLTTQRVQIVQTGTAATALTYDANGNCTQDENGNEYTWDALNRLISITYPGGASSWFAYDGLSRRVQIVEKNSGGTVTSTKNYLWIGSEIAEERDASNTVTKRFFPQGEQQAGTNYYYTRDHLGSVREMLNSSGTIVARYSYDPYGVTTLVQGSNLATKQFGKIFLHQTSGLYLTRFRAFDPNDGRWLSRDPYQEGGGLNLYNYCGENPVIRADRTGLAPTMTVTTTPGAPYSSPIDITIGNCKCHDVRFRQTVADIYTDSDPFTGGAPAQDNDPSDPNNPNQLPSAYSGPGGTTYHHADAPGFYSPGGGLWNLLDPFSTAGHLGHQRFETCAFCFDSNPPKPLGCVTWSQACSIFGTCQITVTGFSSTPSAAFNKAFP
jgi:RHS repeat-associated protein